MPPEQEDLNRQLEALQRYVSGVQQQRERVLVPAPQPLGQYVVAMAAEVPGRVSEVAVVGLPDEKWGQAVTAFVVPERPEITEEEIRSYLKEDTNLARFKHPKKVVFVKEIPKSPVGKLLRRLLVEGEYEEVKLPTEDAEVTA